MANSRSDSQPMSTGTQSQQEGSDPKQDSAAAAGVSGHGKTGEGSGSALAQLISQEQARVVPGAPEDGPTGSA
jgi:hypothetical protein